MALEMWLELEGNPPDWAVVETALANTGVENLKFLREGELDTYFKESNAWIRTFRWSNAPRFEVTAEGEHGCKFTVSEGLIFRINNSKYDESAENIKTFLAHLSELSPMQFVLSFQGEGVYAIRDKKRGFEWLWDAPR